MARIYTTQKTGKGWKGLQALGCLGTLAGLGIVAAGLATAGAGAASRADPRMGGFGMMIALCGAIGWLFARIGGWWSHG